MSDPSSPPSAEGPFAVGVSRRRFVAGGLAAASAAVLPTWLAPATAHASLDSDIDDVLSGIIAFVFPGNDAWSRQQREWTLRPGGVAAGGTASLRETLDEAIAIPFRGDVDSSLPGAAAIVTVVELYARDTFKWFSKDRTVFPRLTSPQKAKVLAKVDRADIFGVTPIRYALNALPTLAALAAFCEAGVRNEATVPVSLTGRPVGWDATNFAGPSDGWDELQGYWKGRTTADGVRVGG